LRRSEKLIVAVAALIRSSHSSTACTRAAVRTSRVGDDRRSCRALTSTRTRDRWCSCRKCDASCRAAARSRVSSGQHRHDDPTFSQRSDSCRSRSSSRPAGELTGIRLCNPQAARNSAIVVIAEFSGRAFVQGRAVSDLLWIAAVIFLVFREPSCGDRGRSKPRSPARLSIALAPASRSSSQFFISTASCTCRGRERPSAYRCSDWSVALFIGWSVLKPFTSARSSIAVFVLSRSAASRPHGETCGDLIYFWGPKGQAFPLRRLIDANFLGLRDYYLMHSDYPPLLPLL